MSYVDLAALGREPDSPIGQFAFHDCICGVAAFRGAPPWEHHTAGDELLFVLSGESDLTVIEHSERATRTISTGDLVIVPQGFWHSNRALRGVTFLYMTPEKGNEYSWEEPTA